MSFKNCKIVGTDIDVAVYLRQEFPRGHAMFSMSPSSVKAFLFNPRRWVRGYNPPDSSSKDWGNIVDAFVTSPHTFADRFIVKPETYPAPIDHDKVKKGEIKAGDPLPWNSNAKVCREWERLNLRNRQPITHDEYQAASEAYNRLLEDEAISKYISESNKQTMIVGEWHSGDVVIPVRCLIDLAPRADSEFSGSLGDLKTTRNASVRSFTRFAHDMGYHIQGAFDLDLWNASTGDVRDTWCFVTQENYRPFETAKHILGQRFIEIGRSQYTQALNEYAALVKAGVKHSDWPGYNRLATETQGWSILEPELWMEPVNPIAGVVDAPADEPETADLMP